ncbi:hypothetical protein AOLI_G00138290 [Acnodon oligacanthus]
MVRTNPCRRSCWQRNSDWSQHAKIDPGVVKRIEPVINSARSLAVMQRCKAMSDTVQQFTYSVQEVINWARSKALDTINIPLRAELLGATARFLLLQTSTREHTLPPHDGGDGTRPSSIHTKDASLCL